MKTFATLLDELPELPVELFELGARLDFSKDAPIITNHPNALTAERRPGSIPRINKSSHQTRLWYAWALYPKVICYPFADIATHRELELHQAEENLHVNEANLNTVAGVRRYYKLSGFRGLKTTFCEVRYGPWFATLTEQESCDDQLPSTWQLESKDPGVALSWLGTWEDRPFLPNLTVIVNLNDIAKVSSECCPGFYFCPTTQSCIPNSVTCPNAYPI